MNEPTANPNESLRKAAVLVRSLPPEAAATLIGRLSAEEAASLRASIADLGEIESEERLDVAEEIRTVSSEAAPEPIESGGVELQISATAEVAPAPQADPFELLRDAEPAAVASYLAGERPRAAALVLSYLAPEVASAVLGQYPEPKQVELLAQMSSLGEADPDAVRILASDLAEWVREKGEEQRRQNDRLDAVRGVLAATDGERRRRLATQLMRQDPATAKRLGLAPRKPVVEQKASRAVVGRSANPNASGPASPPALAFDDLERLDGKDLVAALSEIGGRAAVLALAGASENLLRRVESAVTKKAAKQMRQRIAQLGQTTLAEVDASQQALAAAAERILVARRVRRVAEMN